MESITQRKAAGSGGEMSETTEHPFNNIKFASTVLLYQADKMASIWNTKSTQRKIPSKKCGYGGEKRQNDSIYDW